MRYITTPPRIAFSVLTCVMLVGCDGKNTTDQDADEDTSGDASDVSDMTDVPGDTLVSDTPDVPSDSEDVTDTMEMDGLDVSEDIETDDAGLDAEIDIITDSPEDTGDDSATDTTVDTLLDTSVDTAADTSIDTPVDTAIDTAVDTATDTGLDSYPDIFPDTGADLGDAGTECEALGGTCVSAGACTNCPGSFIPAYGRRGCDLSSWCCLPDAGLSNACFDAGGVCIPDTMGSDCAPGWSTTATECWGVGTLCCEEDPGC